MELAICKLFLGMGIAFAIAGLIACRIDVLNLALWSLLAYVVLRIVIWLFRQLAIVWLPLLVLGIGLGMGLGVIQGVIQEPDKPASLFVVSVFSFMIFGLCITRPSRPPGA